MPATTHPTTTHPAMTPRVKADAGLAALASRYVDVATVAWTPSRHQGVDMKVLMEDKSTGLLTALVRFQPGAKLPDHEHTAIEQSYVLDGSLVDDEGSCTAGNFVWRPAGSRHDAHAPNGALVLAFFLKPNKFFD